MIAQVRGTLTSTDGDRITVMTAAGVAYEIALPVGALSRIPSPGNDVQMHTVLVVREDDWSLFGFDAPAERAVFQRLLQANGVGPRLALAMISALGGDRVVRAIRDGDLAALCSVSGVGKKKAERMVLELKDRMGDLESARPSDAPGPLASQAIAALVGLGYAPAVAESAVRDATAGASPTDASEVIRLALQHLSRS